MTLSWATEAWEDYLYWQATNGTVLKRIDTLISEIRRYPYTGMGKPEPLRHHWAGYRSRRIDREHRLVDKAADDVIVIVQCRYHY